jgi:hypothetical protein
MKAKVSQANPQPFTAIALTAIAVSCLVTSWLIQPFTIVDLASLELCGLALFLAGAIVVVGLSPIHIRRTLKVILTTVPIYVAAVLLPPSLAAPTAGLGTLILQLMTRIARGNTPSDIATASARWVIVAFLTAGWARWIGSAHIPPLLVLLSTAICMFLCDIVTGALEVAPMSGEAPRRVIVLLLREASIPEGAQYLLGILAALAAMQQPWSLILWALPLRMVYQSLRQAKEMHDETSRLLESMADTVDLRDPYTGGHSRRVTDYSVRILRELGVAGPEVELIQAAARVHDIGKIGIPDNILNKPGRLTPDEKRVMDSHSERGAELLARHQDFARGCEIVRHHHECWDGSGYPAGLKGLDIPFGARVIAVADSFDAMTSDRPYRAGMPIEHAARILREGSGQQWDAAIVDAFLGTLNLRAPQPSRAAEPVTARAA